MTYPYQRTVIVHREKPKYGFLGISNETWKAASRNLRPPALLLYLYIAANADNFKLALSPTAVRQEIGMARSTFHDQFHILVDKGYLVNSHGNTYEFYETPQPSLGVSSEKLDNPENELNFESCPDIDTACPEELKNCTPDNKEINNNENLDNEINIPPQNSEVKQKTDWSKCEIYYPPKKNEFKF